MNSITQPPKNQQKVLVNMGNYVDPAIYDADHEQYMRYPNYADGDRCAVYFYSGVLGWWSFPEPSGGKTFANEPELPFPAKDISNPVTKDELANLAGDMSIYDASQPVPEALLFPGKKAQSYHHNTPRESIPVEIMTALCIHPIL